MRQNYLWRVVFAWDGGRCWSPSWCWWGIIRMMSYTHHHGCHFDVSRGEDFIFEVILEPTCTWEEMRFLVIFNPIWWAGDKFKGRLYIWVKDSSSSMYLGFWCSYLPHWNPIGWKALMLTTSGRQALLKPSYSDQNVWKYHRWGGLPRGPPTYFYLENLSDLVGWEIKKFCSMKNFSGAFLWKCWSKVIMHSEWIYLCQTFSIFVSIVHLEGYFELDSSE